MNKTTLTKQLNKIYKLHEVHKNIFLSSYLMLDLNLIPEETQKEKEIFIKTVNNHKKTQKITPQAIDLIDFLKQVKPFEKHDIIVPLQIGKMDVLEPELVKYYKNGEYLFTIDLALINIITELHPQGPENPDIYFCTEGENGTGILNIFKQDKHIGTISSVI